MTSTTTDSHTRNARTASPSRQKGKIAEQHRTTAGLSSTLLTQPLDMPHMSRCLNSSTPSSTNGGRDAHTQTQTTCPPAPLPSSTHHTIYSCPSHHNPTRFYSYLVFSPLFIPHPPTLRLSFFCAVREGRPTVLGPRAVPPHLSSHPPLCCAAACHSSHAHWVCTLSTNHRSIPKPLLPCHSHHALTSVPV